MSIFNSLGSNYNFSFALSALLSSGKKSHLEKLLEKKYQGQVQLFFKGRDALEAALKHYPSEWKVGITGFTCYAVYQAVVKSGHRVVFIDLEKDSLNFSQRTLQSCLKKDPDLKIVILQNTFGFPTQTLKKNGLVFLEDLAHCVVYYVP